MEFNFGQHHTKGEIKKARRKALKIDKQKLQVIELSSASSASQGKHMENFEPANLEKKKIENLKKPQLSKRKQSLIFSIKQEKKLTIYRELNIEIDQIRDLLVKQIILRENKSDLKLNFHNLKMLKQKQYITKINYHSYSFLNKINKRVIKVEIPLLKEQKILKSILEKNTKNKEQKEILIISIKLTFNQKLSNFKKLQKYEEAKKLKEITRIYLSKLRVFKRKVFLNNLIQKISFRIVFLTKKDQGNQLCQKSEQLQTC